MLISMSHRQRDGGLVEQGLQNVDELKEAGSLGLTPTLGLNSCVGFDALSRNKLHLLPE